MQTLKIDIVSDVVCPWCVIGYKRLEIAMEELRDELAFDIDWHPFELNPDMPPEGENIVDHITRKYGTTAEASAQTRQRIAQIGEDLGFEFRMTDDRRIYNTFDAHRVLHWAREQGVQLAFNLALFEAYFTHGENPADPDVLRRIASALGLDDSAVTAILDGDDHAEAVRREEAVYTEAGIHAVPAYIINEKYLISGGQEPATFVRAFRSIAEEAVA